MSIKYCKKTRRQFLLGTGKTMLALPLLPSLLSKEAFAQSAGSISPKMMLFHFDHNNLDEIWIPPSAATTPVGNIGAREVLLRSLSSRTQAGYAFRNARYQNLINNDLVTMIRGFDTAVAYGPGHGNFAFACAEGRNSQGNHPTLDTIIEGSNVVYPSANTGPNVTKALRASLGPADLFYQRSGSNVQVMPVFRRNNIQNFYNEVFSSLTNGTAQPVDFSNQLKSNILNRVLPSFTSFRNSRRISLDDRARLDQHMDHISDLQRSYASMQNNTQTCSRPQAPSSQASNDSLISTQTYLDLYALAFKCGLTKFGVFSFEAHNPQWLPEINIGTATGVHDAIHGGAGNAAQLSAFRAYWGFGMDTIADRFLAQLDEEEGNSGSTYIENMVTGLLCAGGSHGLGGDGGHSGLDSQQILIGNMRGRIRSGNFVNIPRPNGSRRLPLNCFLITLLQLMGVPESEYATATSNGRGFGFYGNSFGSNHPYVNRIYDPVREILT